MAGRRSLLMFLWLCWASCPFHCEKTAAEDIEACWAAVQEEPEQPKLSAEDYLKMALFVADFLPLIQINEIYLCLDTVGSTTPSPNRLAEWTLVSTLSQRFVFVHGCDLDRMSESLRALDENATPEETIPRSLHHPAAVHLATRKGLQATLSAIGEALPEGQSEAYHILLGADLPQCPVEASLAVQWFQASYNRTSTTIKVDEIFLFASGGVNVRVPVVRWKAGGVSKASMSVIHPPGYGPYNFQGHVINVIAMEYQPFLMRANPCRETRGSVGLVYQGKPCPSTMLEGVMIDPDQKKTYANYTGYLIDIIQTLAKRLNFKIKLQILHPEEAEFGLDDGNGTFTGLAGYLQTRKADIALAGFSMTRERLPFMDFSEPIMYAGQSLYVSTNSSLHTIGWNTYVLSFQWGTWLAILLLLIIMTFGLWFLVRRQGDEDPHFTQTYNVAFILFSCLVQQGSWILPTTGRAQAVLWMFWFTSVVLYASYTARLTSFLTVSSLRLPFTTLEEAVHLPEWKIGLQKGTSVIETLKRATPKSSYHSVWQGIERNKNLLTTNEEAAIVRLLTEEKFAFLGEQLTMSYLINGNCSITEIPGSYLAGYVSLGLRKKLPWATVLNQELVKMATGGLLDRMYQHWWGKSVPCEARSPYTELGFSNILTAFLLLIIGGLLSVLLLVFEILLRRHYQKDEVFSRKSSTLQGRVSTLGRPRMIFDSSARQVDGVRRVVRVEEQTRVG
ncbi:probable glutamate receptor [Penaeus monodon]|nr:probable glutamate receptor [Penaeus monodon]